MCAACVMPHNPLYPVVTLCAGYNAAATAEVAVMLMLMLARRADEARCALAARHIGEPVGRELSCKTLGLVGLGCVGSRVAAAGTALGMHVISTRSTSTRAELEALLKASDVVSLHCQLTPATRGLIGARELDLMKPGALLINTARADVVDKEALLAALSSGQLGGVGLDVHWSEPPDMGEPLYM